MAQSLTASGALKLLRGDECLRAPGLMIVRDGSSWKGVGRDRVVEFAVAGDTELAVGVAQVVSTDLPPRGADRRRDHFDQVGVVNVSGGSCTLATTARLVARA
jgi:hypothetical protein